jgi:hypothetical protein
VNNSIGERDGKYAALGGQFAKSATKNGIFNVQFFELSKKCAHCLHNMANFAILLAIFLILNLNIETEKR